MANPPSRHSIISLLIRVWDKIERFGIKLSGSANTAPIRSTESGADGGVHLHIHADIFIPIKHPEFAMSVFTLYAK